MRMWKCEKEQTKDLGAIFATAKAAHVRELAIRDPYCAALQHSKKPEDFLKLIQLYASTLECASVRCKEFKGRDGYVEYYIGSERRVDGVIEAAGIQNGMWPRCR